MAYRVVQFGTGKQKQFDVIDGQRRVASDGYASKAAAQREADRLNREEREDLAKRLGSNSRWNPSRKRKAKKSTTKRISAALSTFLKKQNPAFKRARGVRVQKLKGGAIKFKPEF
jgi:hypothetical protein